MRNYETVSSRVKRTRLSAFFKMPLSVSCLYILSVYFKNAVVCVCSVPAFFKCRFLCLLQVFAQNRFVFYELLNCFILTNIHLDKNVFALLY